MRIGLGFSAALLRDVTPRLSAPPAAAETLMNFLRVVGVMRRGAWSASTGKATLGLTLTRFRARDELTHAFFVGQVCAGNLGWRDRPAFQRVRRNGPPASGKPGRVTIGGSVHRTSFRYIRWHHSFSTRSLFTR